MQQKLKRYAARWKAHGENCYKEANTVEELEAKIFGGAYAPSKNQVIITDRKA